MIYARSETTICSILVGARALFLAKPYTEVSMADIAQAAGVTKGGVYHHFASKEELYVTMMRTFMKENQGLYEAEAIKKGTCRERLYRLSLFFLQLPREKRDIFKLIRRDINIFKNPIRNQLIRSYQDALPQQLEAIIRDGIRDGELAPVDPRLLSWLKVAMVEVILSCYAERIFNSPSETVEFVVNLLFDGVGNKSTAPRSPNHSFSNARIRRLNSMSTRALHRDGRAPAKSHSNPSRKHAP